MPPEVPDRRRPRHTASRSAGGATALPSDDRELLAAHASGDPDAFGELIRRHRDRLWAVALRTTGDREEAADALQDAMLSAYRAAAGFRGDSAVTTWLHRIVVNACLDRIRRRQVRATVPLPETGPGEPVQPGDQIADRDTALVVHRALAEIPAEQRAALVLVELQGHSVAEAAEILGVAEGTIKSRCARGRARLALLLGHLRNPDEAPGVQAEPNRRGRSTVTYGPDLDLLADYAAGVLDGTPEGAVVAERIATDPEWADLHAALIRADEAVRADLAALPMPEIPEDVAARLDRALESEVGHGEGVAGAAGGSGTAMEAGRVDAGAEAGRSGAVVPMRRRRSWGFAGGAVAAGVAVLAAGAIGIQALTDGGPQRDTTTAAAPESADTAEKPAPSAAPPRAAPGAVPETYSGLRSSGAEYRSDTLRAQVEQLVRSQAQSDASAGKAVPGPLARLSNPAAFSDCLAALGADARPLAVDYARYDGEPAVVVVLPALASGQVDVAVVGPDCGLSGSDLKHRSNVTL